MSKQYKKAMDKVVLSEAFKEKIISDLSLANKNKKFKNSNTKIFYLRTFAGIAACFALCIAGFSVMKNFAPIKPIKNSDFGQTENYNPSGEKNAENESNSDNTAKGGETDFEVVPKTDFKISGKDGEKSENRADENIAGITDLPNDEKTPDQNPPLLQSPSGENNESPQDKENPGSENGGNPNDEMSPPVLGGNPYADISDIAELEKALGYAVNVPSYLPDGYSSDSICLISGTLVQINYSNGTDEITLRTERGKIGDISGVYQTFENFENIEIGDITAHLKGNGEKINLAEFQKNGCAYSLYSPSGLEKEEFIKIIDNI